MFNALKEKIDSIPAHVRYPGMVVAFLVGSVLSQVALLSAATSDGGAQVEPDYYDRAVAWDEHMERQGASARLGWTATLDLRDGRGVLTLTDEEGAPVAPKKVEVIVTRPHVSGVIATRELDLSAADMGFELPHGQPGLWDVRVEVEGPRGERFTQKLRREW
jgi:nitrogen fixation protein FixH